MFFCRISGPEYAEKRKFSSEIGTFFSKRFIQDLSLGKVLIYTMPV